MIFFIFSLFIFVACNSSAMRKPTKYTRLSKEPATKKHTAIKKVEASSIPCESKWKAELTYKEYKVKPSEINDIESETVLLPEGKALGYDAVLHNGDQVTCFLILEGEYTGEKWALLYKQDYLPIPIPADNFDIVKKLYDLIGQVNFNR